MKKLKHNKVKNTGILFELLTRQLTADVLNNKQKPKSAGLLKKYFSKSSPLGKELQLYNLLMKENFNSENKANKFIDIVISHRNKLKNSDLRKEKYNLIKEIKDNYPITDFFKSKIKNYKLYASIHKLFEFETSIDEYNPSDMVNTRYTIVESVVTNKIGIVKGKKSKTLSEYNSQDKDLRLLAYKILVDRFNSKYKTLDNKQKSLLKEYINNISNTNELHDTMQSEVISLKKIFKLMYTKVNEKITKIKLREAVNQMDKFVLSKNKITEKNILSLMRYYELAKELKKCVVKKK